MKIALHLNRNFDEPEQFGWTVPISWNCDKRGFKYDLKVTIFPKFFLSELGSRFCVYMRSMNWDLKKIKSQDIDLFLEVKKLICKKILL